jgi:hypothetical protein
MQSQFKLLCNDGCRDWTETNYKSAECNNGESASQAVVVRSDYKATAEGSAVFSALLNGQNKVAGE